MENIYCVYCHRNIINNKKYYGQTKKNPPEMRWHKDGSGYRSNTHFWDAICKYGWNNFEHIIIKEGLTLEEANKLETQLIIQDKTYDANFGYNNNYGGDNHKMLDSTKLKLSECAKQRTGELNPFYGKQHTDETKQKISNKKKGCKGSMTGKHHTAEARENMSKARMGKEPWNKGLVGIHHDSDETRRKKGIASKKNWENEEFRTKSIKSRTGLKRSEEFKKKQSENAKGNTNVRGMHWYNNGVDEIRAYECPEGYVPGRCNKYKGTNQFATKIS